MIEPSDIDRLIDEGLTRYGQGDLDGALGAWERALAIDPENPQVASYVEYVRHNYDLLTGDGGEALPGAPFGIGDDEPYQIEILPGDELAGPPPIALEPVDSAWFIEDELAPRRPRTISKSPPAATEAEPEPEPLTIELDADEPPPPISFDDETREYQGPPGGRRAEPAAAGPPPVPPGPPGPPGPGDPIELDLEAAPPFGATDEDLGLPTFETTTSSGFTTESTDVRRRETGFVQPAATRMPEVQITMRTPPAAPAAPAAPAGPPPIAIPAVEPPHDHASVDLIDSLPSPTPSPLAARTRDLPLPSRAPASSTRPPADTRDFSSGQETAKLPNRSPPATPPPMSPTTYQLINAPTRDLGLREVAGAASFGSTPMTPPPDDEPTTLRRNQLDEGTLSVTHRYVPPLDPIEARGAEILEHVDAGAPLSEPTDDRTRRRITTLFEQAAAWTRGGDLERAVIAIDLALSEDPSSALAQKLIHRNRDTMMAAFQAFLGDLDRQPMLARPLHELAGAPISPRAAFLLSRIDGSLSLEEILDVSGMPRLEAYRYLCQLFLRGILR